MVPGAANFLRAGHRQFPRQFIQTGTGEAPGRLRGVVIGRSPLASNEISGAFERRAEFPNSLRRRAGINRR